MTDIDRATATELEAAAFHQLVSPLARAHRRAEHRPDESAGFCRNCLSNWYQEAAAERELDLGKEAARQIIYGMPYKEWQQRYQA